MKATASASFVLFLILIAGPAAPAASVNQQAVPPVIDMSESSAAINFGHYRLEFKRESGELGIYRGSNLIAASPSGEAALSIRSGETRRPLSGLENVARNGDGLTLSFRPSGSSGPVEIDLTGYADRFRIEWDTGSPGPEVIEAAFALEPSGHWYGGNVTSGHNWPLETGEIELDPYLAASNQNTPFLMTSGGFGFFSATYQPVGLAINAGGDGAFRFRWRRPDVVEFDCIVGRTIVDVYRTFMALAGVPRTVPPKEYFTDPIFNTWIELKIDVDQNGVTQYARKIRETGFPCAILDIDDRWQRAYGDHEFDPKKFPDPRAMVDEIHRLGFKLALWVVPFIHTDAVNYRTARKSGYLVMDQSGKEPAMVRWWNGRAALVDLSNPAAYRWFLDDMKSVEKKYGIDGFKLDGGDADFFRPEFRTYGNVTPNRYTDLFADLGRHFRINEYRVSWLVQPLGLVQRLRDKNADWSARSGLGSLVPHGLTESMIGYPFFCPDMIGGGLDSDFRDEKFKGMDPEMFVRWTQASSLMPMMQFSYAPWNLDAQSVDICLRYARLHKALGEYIYRLAAEVTDTALPIIRPLFFQFPDDETAYGIADQFMLGDRFLVAPVIKPGAVSRSIYLPAGTWQDKRTDEVIVGPTVLKDYPAPLEVLPVFVRL